MWNSYWLFSVEGWVSSNWNKKTQQSKDSGNIQEIDRILLLRLCLQLLPQRLRLFHRYTLTLLWWLLLLYEIKEKLRDFAVRNKFLISFPSRLILPLAFPMSWILKTPRIAGVGKMATSNPSASQDVMNDILRSWCVGHVHRWLILCSTWKGFIRKIMLELWDVEDIVGTITNRQVDLIGIVTNKLFDGKGTFKL